MKLDLIDFGQLKEISENVKENSDNDLEKEVEILKNKIEQLLKQSELEKENSYKKGVEEATKTLEQKYQKILEEKIEELKSQYEKMYDSKIKQIQDVVEEIQRSLKDHYQVYLTKIAEIISDSIAEILEFLYINTKEPEKVAEKINEILEELRDFKVLQIKVSKDQNIEILQRLIRNINIETDDKLEGNDFIIEFDNGRIENKLKEKIWIIKDEIKREIKKLSEI